MKLFVVISCSRAELELEEEAMVDFLVIEKGGWKQYQSFDREIIDQFVERDWMDLGLKAENIFNMAEILSLIIIIINICKK